jgi:hypothetical protein
MSPQIDAWISRSLLGVGLLAVAVGTIDPLEGSIVILGGFTLIAIAAYRRRSRQRIGLSWSVLLVGVGVGAMFSLSAMGGVGGTSGHSAWWAVTILPYPVGWLVGVIESVQLAREHRSRRLQP